MNQLFDLGRIVGTSGALKTLNQADVFTSIMRHQNGDWGDVCQQDRETNDWALLQGNRLLSVYQDSQGVKFWVITEADRSVTTVLLPNEY